MWGGLESLVRGKSKKSGSTQGQRLNELEGLIRQLGKLFEKNGVEVRREKLCSGPAFKVKSGNCFFSGKNLIFVDKRLPADQQLSVLCEHLAEADFDFSEGDLEGLPVQARDILSERIGS